MKIVIVGAGAAGSSLAERVSGEGQDIVIIEADRALLSSLMIAGRLEIFPVVLLFTRNLWRR